MTYNAIPLIEHYQKKKIKKVIGLMKDKLGKKIMTKIVGLKAKTYIYFVDDGGEDKKVKGTKKCVINLNLKIMKIV